MTPQDAWEKRYAPLKFADAAKHIQTDWLTAWTIAGAVCIADERERCAKLCDEWARICDSGRRHGAKVGAQECAKLIRQQDDSQ